jgi:hypothetical protein
MKKPGIMATVLLTHSIASAYPLLAQVNMQYSGQYRGQFSGQYSGRYYGVGSVDQIGPRNRRVRYEDRFGYPVNSGACGELYYPPPGTDHVLHDRQGRRCY